MTAPASPKPKGHWPTLAVFGAIVSVQLAVACLSLDVMAAVRSYVTGESLYSKAQKNAYAHLMDYSDSRSEADYALFLRELAYPIGDKIARESLQAGRLEDARAGFVQGGSDPEDIPGLIRLFRVFHATPLMTGSIAAWTRGDELVEQMGAMGEQARQSALDGSLGAGGGRELRANARSLNERLTALEIDFSTQLSDAARATQRLLLAANFALAAMLGASGFLFVRRSAKLEAAAKLDSLTGLANRRAAEEALDQMAERLTRHGERYALVMLDIDHFKAVNDRFGHPGGDAVLKACSREILLNSRPIDVAGRLGGEEFCVILPGLDIGSAHQAAEALRARVEGLSIRYDGHAIAITASFGVGACSSSNERPTDLMKRVDAALYKAKEAGRNRVCVADGESPKVVGIGSRRRRKFDGNSETGGSTWDEGAL